jgi:hypothetical protein
LLIAYALLAAGCSYPTDAQPGYTTEGPPAYATAPEPGVPTSLVIVVEGESTEAEYLAKRHEIVAYLIDRGYITSEDDLIGDPDEAERIVRAIVTADGFTLSIFNKNTEQGPPPDLEDSDILYPADPYFIWGFMYAGEIGLRHLPHRPRDYHPHPRPRHQGPMPGHPIYDHDRHWSHAGGPGRGVHHGPPQDRDHHDNRPPQPSRGVRAPESGPAAGNPGNQHPPHPEGNGHTRPNTPVVGPPRNPSQPRPDDTRHPPQPPGGVQPNRNQTQPNKTKRPQPATTAPHAPVTPPPRENAAHVPTPPGRPAQYPPANSMPRNSNPPTSRPFTPPAPRNIPPPPRSSPPPSRPAPAPAPAEKSPPPSDEKDTRKAQN